MADTQSHPLSLSSRRDVLRVFTFALGISGGQLCREAKAEATDYLATGPTFRMLKMGFPTAGRKVIRTSGFEVVGVGAATYVARDDLDITFATRNPLQSCTSSDGLVFVILESAPDVTMFGADPSGKSDSYDAFDAALEYCNRLGSLLRIPAGRFIIERSNNKSGFDLECDVVGNGPRSSKIISRGECPVGPLFRIGAYRRLADVSLFREGKNDNLTGISIRAVERASFTGHVVIERVWIEGFWTNILLSNCYQWAIRDCIIQYGQFGIRFDRADRAGSTDSGYFTDGTIENCFINGNGLGIELDSQLKSTALRITSTAIQHSRGVKAQARFRNIRPLSLNNCYFEARPDVAAVEMAECDATMENTAFIGTGGIDIGSAWGSLVVRRCFGTLPSDGIRASGGQGQSIAIEDSEFVGAVRITSQSQTVIRSKIGSTLSSTKP